MNRIGVYDLPRPVQRHAANQATNNDFLYGCALYASLYQMGFQSNILHSALEMLSKSDMARVLPLQPWSRLGLDYNLCKLGLLRRSEIRKHDLYINECPKAWVVSGDPAYAITHEVFHLSDFGFSSPKDSDVVTYLNRWIPHYLSKLNSPKRADFGHCGMLHSVIAAAIGIQKLRLIVLDLW